MNLNRLYRFTVALCFIFTMMLLGACGGGGGNGGSDDVSEEGDNADNTATSINVKTLSPSAVSFERHLSSRDQISLLFPSHWDRLDASRTDWASGAIVSFIEQSEGVGDYQETVLLIKADSMSEITNTMLSNRVEVSTQSVSIAGFVGQEEIFDANLQDREQFDLRFMQMSFEFNGSAYALLYSGERDVFDRNVDLVRYMASHMDVGQVVLSDYSLSQPGKTAAASDGSDFLFVSCRAQADNRRRYDLIGRIVNADRSMGDEFVIDTHIGVTCNISGYQAIFDGEQYLAVYTAYVNGSRKIIAKRIDTSGNVIDSSPIQISNNAAGWSYMPDIAVDGDRSFIVWHESVDNEEDINGVFVTNDGSVGSVFNIVADLQNTYADPNVGIYTPKIAKSDNQFMVAWNPYFFRDTRKIFPRSVYGQILDLSGNSVLTEPMLIREDFGHNPRYIDIASDGENFLVGWVEGLLETNSIGSGNFEVYARQISPAGEIIQGEDPDAGIEIASPMIVSDGWGSFDEVPKDFLDLSFANGQYSFLWSSTNFDPETGVYLVDVSQDLNTISQPFAIAGTDIEAYFGISRPRQVSMAHSDSATVIAWVSDSMEAWFFNHVDGFSTRVPASDVDDTLDIFASTTAELNRSNAPSFFSVLHEFTALGEQLLFAHSLNWSVPEFHMDNNMTETTDCFGGGTISTVVSDDGRRVSEEYDNCDMGYRGIANGNNTIEFSDVDENNTYTVAFNFENYIESSSEESKTFDGSVEFLVSTLDLFDPFVTMNIEIVDAQNGSVMTQGFSFNVIYRFSDFPSETYNFSGQIGSEQYGTVNVNSNSASSEIHLKGNNSSKMTVEFFRTYSEIIFYQNGIIPSSNVRISADDFFDANFLDSANIAPSAVGRLQFSDYGVSSNFLSPNVLRYQGVEGRPYEFDVLGSIRDENGDPLTYQVSVQEVAAVSDRGYPTDEFITDENFSIHQVGASRFVLVAQSPGQYTLEVRGTDNAGETSDSEFLLITIVADTDRDGFFDYDDPDDDNDGIRDSQDAFPKDASETTDFDRDEIGDNADADDDNDGVDDDLDVYPLNNLCSLSYQGDGVDCYVETVYTRNILFDGNGELYFYEPGRRDIARWDVDSGEFIEQLIVGAPLDVNDVLVTGAYSAAHQRLYFGFSSGAITYVDVGGAAVETLFENTSESIEALIDAGDYLLVFHDEESGYSKANITVYDVNASQTAVTEGSMPRLNIQDYRNNETFLGRGYVLDTAQNIFYDDFDNGDLDLNTGEIIPEQEKIESPFLLGSPNGELTLRSNGQIIEIETESVVGNIDRNSSSSFVRGKMAWTDLGISLFRNNGYERVNAEGVIQERYELSSRDRIALYEYGEQLIIVSRGSPFDSYLINVDVITPSDDTDGDGVENLVDRYPNDPSASVDDDHDGYPDLWNPLSDGSDSTEGLILDAYPGALDCYLPSHGDGIDCDPSTTVRGVSGDFVHTAMSQDGVIYIAWSHIIYRYSLAEEKYLPSIFVGNDDPYDRYKESPQQFAFSEADDRIYLSYTDKVTVVDLNSESLEESELLSLDRQSSGLLVTDDYLVVAIDTLDVARLYYDKSGNFVQDSKAPFRVESMAWDPLSNKIYTTVWPYDIYVEDLDVDDFTGEATLLAELDNDGPLLKLSLDGQYFIRSKNNIYNAETGEEVIDLSSYIYDALWLSNGNLATANSSALMLYDESFTEISVVNLGYRAVALFEFDGEVVVVGSDRIDDGYSFETFSSE